MVAVMLMKDGKLEKKEAGMLIKTDMNQEEVQVENKSKENGIKSAQKTYVNEEVLGMKENPRFSPEQRDFAQITLAGLGDSGTESWPGRDESSQNKTKSPIESLEDSGPKSSQNGMTQPESTIESLPDEREGASDEIVKTADKYLP